mmetsp:Transcript_44446/g.117997  ORF Transcript_44446/g.117997 Transcript_44446/m.117997 type:complete len:456 (-) Transcript_44446:221-1588(-)
MFLVLVSFCVFLAPITALRYNEVASAKVVVFDSLSTTAVCLGESDQGNSEFQRGVDPQSNVGACAAAVYPRSCLRSVIPLGASYTRIKACFRCCLFYWTEKLQLGRNLRSLESNGLLMDEFSRDAYHHNQTEVILSANSLMKFADVAFTNNLFHFKVPGRDKNGIIHFGTHYELDRFNGHRPCAVTNGTRCVIQEGGVISARKFYYDTEMFKRLGSWAQTGSNLTVMFNRDVMQGMASDWEMLNDTRIRWYQTNPGKQGFDFPVANNSIDKEDRLFFPLGMNSNIDPTEQDRLLTKHRGNYWENTGLFYCRGIKVKGEPLRVERFRRQVLEALSKHFDCDPEGQIVKSEGYFKNMASHKFVLSPRGGGHNCYRTWEILAFGSIPVVDHHPALEDLYRNLPVVQVKDWSQVTPAFLVGEWSRITQSQRNDRVQMNIAKAFLPYWIDEIYGEIPAKI